jgi:transcriptional regulator with XRE-family HTH domain
MKQENPTALRIARIAAGFSQSDLAKRTRTSQIFVSRLERNDSARLTPKIVTRFARALGVPLEKLFSEVGE